MESHIHFNIKNIQHFHNRAARICTQNFNNDIDLPSNNFTHKLLFGLLNVTRRREYLYVCCGALNYLSD